MQGETNTKEEKKRIRKKIRAERDKLSREEVADLSRKIWINFKDSVLDNSRRNIMLYHSFSSEVYTHEIIRELYLKEYDIFLPRMEDNEIITCEYDFVLNMNSHGIYEPSPDSVIENPSLDMIIVPGIAFDRKGNRLGWGLGYYDRFLKKMYKTSPRALIVSPAYSFQVVNRIPSEDHDKKIDVIITEKGVINVPAKYTCV